MKNSKLAKLLVMLLSLTLLIGSAIGIAVSATGEDTITDTGAIEAKTIIHNDKIQLGFYIDATAEDLTNGTFTVEYYWGEDGDVKNAVVRADGNRAGSTLVATEGVAYYELTKVATVTVKKAGAVVDTAKYSVAQFLYAKLYADGFIDSTDAGEKLAGEVYQALIDLGAKSQTYLDYEPYALVSDATFIYVEDENCTLNGTDRYLYNAPGEDVTFMPVYNGTETLSGWTIIYKDGSTGILDKDTEAVLSACAVIKPEFVKASNTVYSFDGNSIDSTSNLAFSYILSNAAATTTSTVTSPSTSINKDARPSAYDYGTYLSIKADPENAVNQVLSIDSSAHLSSGYITSGGSNATTTVNVVPEAIDSDGTYAVFDIDLYLDYSAGEKAFHDVLYLYLKGDSATTLPSDGTTSKKIILSYRSSTQATIDGETEYKLKAAGIELDAYTGQWVNFKIVVDNAKYYLYYSVNGGTSYTFVAETSHSLGSNITNAVLSTNLYKVRSQIYADNISFVKTGKVSFALADGTTKTFE
ncbi:MAG: hypothetical protein IJ488_01785 [Clostridia bacterium]|nr:hypothetical protein [Clostridia bacterium]